MLPFAEITVTGFIGDDPKLPQLLPLLRDVVLAMFHLKTFEATADDPSA